MESTDASARSTRNRRVTSERPAGLKPGPCPFQQLGSVCSYAELHELRIAAALVAWTVLVDAASASRRYRWVRNAARLVCDGEGNRVGKTGPSPTDCFFFNGEQAGAAPAAHGRIWSTAARAAGRGTRWRHSHLSPNQSSRLGQGDGFGNCGYSGQCAFRTVVQRQ